MTDLDFADDAFLFAETIGLLADALESLSKKAKPLGLQIFWTKTKVKAFGDILDATIESIPVSGRESGSHADVHLPWHRDSFVYQLRTRNQSTTRTRLERNELVGRSSLALPILVQKDECSSVLLAGPAGPAVFLKTWTLSGKLRQRLNSCGTMSLYRILVDRLHYYMSNDLVLSEAGLRPA